MRLGGANVSVQCHRVDDKAALTRAIVASETIEGRVIQEAAKRQRRSAEENRWIVEPMLLPGASTGWVPRDHGVNGNQGFQCAESISVWELSDAELPCV
jgi:hypothetical protein